MNYKLRSPFADKSTILTQNKLVKIKGERKEMFYLTMHSTHFIYGYMASKGKRTILTKTHVPCFSAENENSVFDSRFRNFPGVSVVADFRWL